MKVINALQTTKTFLALSLCTSLTLTGCDKSHQTDKTNATTTNATTASTQKIATVASTTTTSTTNVSTASATKAVTASSSTLSSPVTANQNIAATSIVEQMMGMMAIALTQANQIAIQKDGKPKFTKEQINCFINDHNEIGITKIQEYLTKKLSAEEIKQVNDFFASDAGKKQVNIAKQMAAGMTGDTANFDPVANAPTAEQQKQMEDFWKNGSGKKLATALQDKKALQPYVAPLVKEKEQQCHMPK